MKRIGQLLLTVVMVAGTAACGVTSYALKGSSTTARDEVYACAVRQLSAMNYEIDQEDRETGFVRGHKMIGLWWQRNYGFWGGNTFNDIVVALAEGESGAPPRVEVSGETYMVAGSAPGSGIRSYQPPSALVQADVSALLSMCKVGDLTGATAPKN